MLKEFKEFALKGNVVDMAVGIIIGAAFSTIVRSLVDDIVMPPLGRDHGPQKQRWRHWTGQSGENRTVD